MGKAKAVALLVLQSLEEAGFEAYLVGGCVRDEVMNRSPKDYDITTNAHPRQIQQLFPCSHPTGIRFGTITVIQKDISIQVTTFRTEEGYLRHRRPEKVQFVSSLKEDLSRRDFTINALAKDRQGRLYDYFGGLEDIKKKQIRTVGTPQKRFHEDALRIIRAIRFVATLQFQLEEETACAIKQAKELCRFLPVERVVQELRRILESRSPSIAIQLFNQYRLWHTIPPFHSWNMDKMNVDLIQKLDRCQDPVVRLAYLLFLCQSDPENLSSRLQDLKLSSQERNDIKTCYHIGMMQGEWKAEKGKEMLLLYGFSAMNKAAQFVELLTDESHMLYKHIRTWWDQMPVKQLSELACNAQSLLTASGIPPGPWMKKTLHYLLKQVALGKLDNHESDLIQEGCAYGRSIT